MSSHGPQSLVVRRAETGDLDALVAVQAEGAVAGLAHIFPQERYPFPRAVVRRRWADELDDPDTGVYVGLDETDVIVAFAAIRADEILHFGTARHTWGTGTAQVFHAALLERLPREAIAGRDGHLRLRVFERNLRARRFYEKLGWVQTPRRSRSSFAPYAVLVEYRLTCSC